jgi:hypothetical protein
MGTNSFLENKSVAFALQNPFSTFALVRLQSFSQAEIGQERSFDVHADG